MTGASKQLFLRILGKLTPIEFETITQAAKAARLHEGVDAHAKNYSLILRKDRVVFAPLYDIASSLPYELSDHKLKLAMKLGSDYNMNMARPQLWARLASTVRLPENELVDRAGYLLESIPDAFSAACSDSQLDGLVTSLPARLLEAVTKRAEVCLRSLPVRGGTPGSN